MTQLQTFKDVCAAAKSDGSITVEINGQPVTLDYIGYADANKCLPDSLSSFNINFQQPYGYSSGYPNVVTGADFSYYHDSGTAFMNPDTGDTYTITEICEGL